jgi:hypothetical protein
MELNPEKSCKSCLFSEENHMLSFVVCPSNGAGWKEA